MSMSAVDILSRAKACGASDVVFVAESAPFMRLEGDWRPIVETKLSTLECEEMIRSLLPEDRRESLVHGQELNFSRHIQKLGRLRFNVHHQRDTLAATIRLIWPRIRTMEELELPEALASLVLKKHGLMLVCGRAGAGKSTTLAALVHHILQNRRAHVITIEDPIEYVHKNGIGICEQREIEADTPSWQDGLKNVLRQSPDVIVVGELQDKTSIETAVSAAETGHLVMASVHAQDTVRCVTRIVDVFGAAQQDQIRLQLSGTLLGVLAQELVPTVGGDGRVLCTELLVANTAVRNQIRHADYGQMGNTILSGRDIGMHTMQDSLERLLSAGRINQEEMINRLNDCRMAGSGQMAGV